MLINLSNHPSDGWGQEQTEAARKYGDIEDIPFPAVCPEATHEEVCALADDYARLIASMAKDQHVTVHVMGEMTFTFRIVTLLKQMGIDCVASATERHAETLPDGKKLSGFSFVRFRSY